MGRTKTLVEFEHDEGYGGNLLPHINGAILGKDMIALRVVRGRVEPDFDTSQYAHLKAWKASPADFDVHVSRLFVKPADRQGRLNHATLGVTSEAGELATAVKKAWIYGSELDKENVLEEVGDSLFYLTALLHECGSCLQDAIDHNMAKLAKRYPEGFSEAAALARADKADQ